MTVRFMSVDARSVFNLTSPRYLPQLALKWRGVHDWWDARYEPVRDICERRYIEEFNKRTGHYTHLEASILEHGFRNPIMLTAGRLLLRKPLELPPDLRARGDTLVCEYIGGSRLLIAAKLGLWLPAIINDFRNDVHAGLVIAPGDTQKIASLFTDPPREINWNEHGTVHANYCAYSHYPEAKRISFVAQKEIRRQVISEVLKDVRTWMAENDNDYSEGLQACAWSSLAGV